MPLDLHWSDVAIRLGLTVFAGIVIGLNRQERGRPAGMRTTVLVCLAASVSMIQCNLLLATNGKSPASFVVLDLMRLPLGILSGMGFIGGGVILKRGNLVLGVTTAATLWFVTAMGLCFGGGQLSLGMTLLALGISVLWGLKKVERHLPVEYRATFSISLHADKTDADEIPLRFAQAGYRVSSVGISLDRMTSLRELQMNVAWAARPEASAMPAMLEELAKSPGVARLRWLPQGNSDAISEL